MSFVKYRLAASFDLKETSNYKLTFQTEEVWKRSLDRINLDENITVCGNQVKSLRLSLLEIQWGVLGSPPGLPPHAPYVHLWGHCLSFENGS